MPLLSPKTWFSRKCNDSVTLLWSDDPSTASSDCLSISPDSPHLEFPVYERSFDKLMEDKDVCQRLPSSASSQIGFKRCTWKSDLDMDDEVVINSEWFVDDWNPCAQNPALWISRPPHDDCQCRPRSACPEFVRRHFIHVVRKKRYLPGTLFTAYSVCADEYARACEALSLPTAKLQRARAEYDWALSRRIGSTFWPPRLQEQLLSAKWKLDVAEQEREDAIRRRWHRAHSLMEIGKF